MKLCSKCNTSKDEENFSWKNKQKKIRQTICRSCHKISRRKHYLQNRESEKKRIKRRREEIREWCKQIKRTLKCNRCPQNHPATLQFHHNDPTRKELAIAVAVTNGWSKKKIMAEMEKCEVLCANCHAIEHAGLV